RRRPVAPSRNAGRHTACHPASAAPAYPANRRSRCPLRLNREPVFSRYARSACIGAPGPPPDMALERQRTPNELLHFDMVELGEIQAGLNRPLHRRLIETREERIVVSPYPYRQT